MKKNILLGFSFLIMFLGVVASVNSPSAHAQAGFNYTDHLMDDAVFRASNTMSAADIQTFLVNKGSGLATYKDIEDCSGSHASYFYAYYSCDHTTNLSTPLLASQIIYDVAQAYGINPQVILSTLQKEQSLVTSVNPTASQINYAMGYGCPDSGSCNYPGFFTQIDNATWQFRFDYERLTGNNTWWNNTTSYPCSTSTRYYNQPLLVGNNVTFKDDAGTGYATFILPNASTATLYCYTPHVYPGSSQQYYSGSYWFVYYFNLWFVPYSAIPTGQSYYPTLIEGQSTTSYFTFRNGGYQVWYDDASAWSAGQKVVKLGTDNDLNRSSIFGSTWRWGPTRATDLLSAVYEADGTTLASNQHVVQPGQIAKFSFTMSAPLTAVPGFYGEAFRPIVEGLGPMNPTGTWLGVTVVKADYSARPMGQSYYPTIIEGQSTTSYIRYKNIGNVTWYDNVSAWAAGQKVVKLGTDNDLNRNSAFGSTWKWGPTRATDVFGAVYEANGTTPATDQHVVVPGQIVEFDFKLSVNYGQAAGLYGEAFRPIVEGLGPMNPTGTWLGVTVVKATYSAQQVGQSYYPSIIQGQNTVSYFTFKNIGNTAWYDDVSAWTAGQKVVKLGTDNDLNRSSLFGSTWRWGPTRATDLFSAVYEADGVTLAVNQHVVQPGQIAKFSFTLSAPLAATPGFYGEAFRPIVEGLGPMNPTGTWLGVTVVKAT